MADFDFVLQLRRSYVRSLVAELGDTARPLIARTFDEIPPVEVAAVDIHPVLNPDEGSFDLGFAPDANAVELLLDDAEVQLAVRDEGDEGIDVLHEMRAGLRIELPLEGRDDADTVAVGFDAAALQADAVTVAVNTGHPLQDDEAVIDLINRSLQRDFFLGDIPAMRDPDPAPLPEFEGVLDTFIRVMNEDGGDAARTIRVVDAAGADRFRLLVPLEVWAEITPDATSMPLPILRFTATLQIDFDLERQLETAPAFVEAHIGEGDAALVGIEPIENGDVLNDPEVRNALEGFVAEQGVGLLGDIDDPRFDTFTLEQIEAQLEQLVADTIRNDGRFIPIWEAPRSTELLNVTPRVLADVLAIGINAGPGADIDAVEAFVPFDRDFAVDVSGDFFLENLETFLHSPASYDDIEGTLRLAGEHAAGATTIAVDGFSEETGTVVAGTLLSIDGSNYAVTADAEISDSAAGLPISPGLFTDASDDRRVRFVPGFGLPRTFDAGGLDRTVRLHDLDPSLHEERLRLSGPFRLRRPKVVIKNIDGSVRLDLALDWAGIARVHGDGQTGSMLEIRDYSFPTRRLTRDSILIVDGIEQGLRVAEDVDVEGPSVTLPLSADLPSSPDDGTMVMLQWLAIGRVDGAEQVSDLLEVESLELGADLIPEGAIVRAGGEAFLLTADAPIEGDEATLQLHEEMGDITADGGAVIVDGGWWGRAVVDGDDQTGATLAIREIVRTVPGGASLSIETINGTFTVDQTADITDDAATLGLDHSVVETLGQLAGADTGQIWNLLGQPGDGAVVRMRVARQKLAPRLVGDPDPVLDSPIEGVLGFLIGFFLTLFTGSLFLGVVVAAIVALVTRAIIRAVGGKAVSDQLASNLISAPLPAALKSLDLEVESHFNNPIVITEHGLRLAGSASPASRFPDVEESRARTNGPYHFQAGVGGTFAGDHQAPETDYLWRTGDGSLLVGLEPGHTYPRRGLYVADLSSFDRQSGVEIRTRHLTAVRVANSPPVIGALAALHANEGEEVQVSAEFTDVAWLDSHRAFVDFGDGTLPVEADVQEDLGPPVTTGRLTATHTYCDNGTFTVTVILQDQQGGTDRQTTEALIANVPPWVDAGEDVFAHPCAPLRLAGYFEDPGWCDTHTGRWDFGDCSPLFPATILEDRTPPRATGYAIATHCYRTCGTHLATLTIRDDDGAEASDTRVVRYSDLIDGDFGGGFAQTPLGRVGNGWTPYASPVSSSAPPRNDVFDCETCVVCSGSAAQGIRAVGVAHAGIMQTLGVNPGWEYQFVADVSLQPSPGGDGARVRLGTDPAGGSDPTADGVVWSSVEAATGWQRLSVRGVAEARRLTVFLEVYDPATEPAVFDCVAMRAHPCPLELDPREPREPVRRCVTWLGQDPARRLHPQTVREGFTFSTLSGADLTIVTFGIPVGDTKLRVPDAGADRDAPDGLRLDWEGEASAIEITASGPPGSRISLLALDEQGDAIQDDASTQGDVRTLTVDASRIAAALVLSDHRGTLLDVCIEQRGRRREASALQRRLRGRCSSTRSSARSSSS